MVKYRALGILDKIRFLAVIKLLAPGNDIGGWDHIARHMNYYLHEKGLWNRQRKPFSKGGNVRIFTDSDLNL